jgi:benzoate-CoA ligase family protein
MLSRTEIPERLNLASYFLDANLERGDGDRTALLCGERTHTYADVAARANRAGNALRALGVRRGDRVLIVLRDGVDFVASWYGALKIGAVVAELYTFLPAKDYAYHFEYARAPVAVIDASVLDRARDALRAVRRPPRLLVVGASPGTLVAGEDSFEDQTAACEPELDPAPTARDEIAIWKFTTGSTGTPKAAVHRAQAPVVSFHAYALGTLGLTRDDVVLPVPKLFFGYARDLTTLFPFGVGAAGVLFPDRSTPDRIFELIERHRPTVLVQVPTMIAAMAAHPDAPRRELGCLRFCTSSGEALPVELYRRWYDTFGVEVLDTLGSSEMYHAYIATRPGAVRPGHIGQVVPGYEATLVGPDGSAVGDGETGELVIRGDSAAIMYWDDEPRSRTTFAGDTIRTGDLLERDADGYFGYRGRADDLLKVGGIWVAPAEIERCLLEHPSVAACAVVGHERDGLALTRAFVVPSGDRPADRALAEELQAFVRARLSPHKRPREVRFVAQLPTAANGKVDRRALRARREVPA